MAMELPRDDSYIKRSLEPVLRAAAGEFPAVTLCGPRQAGKTTLLRQLFGHTHRYVSLEPPDVRAAAETDPRGFLARHPAPLILDEIQHAPGLLPFIKEAIDARPTEGGQYLLAGSRDLALGATVAQALAGRAAALLLLPLARREARAAPQAPLPWERPVAAADSLPTESATPNRWDLWHGILRGGYPELAAGPGRSHARWHEAYLQTYFERDVRSLRAIGDLTLFYACLRALAARGGQLLNVTDLARDLGTAPNTVRGWIAVLEATCQVRIVRPWPGDVGRRLVRTPKLYFTDTGLLCHLVGLRDPEHAAAGPLGGALLRTAVLSELTRTLAHRGRDPAVWFLRASGGAEVDFLVEHEGGVVPLEVTLCATPRPALGDALRRLRALLGERCLPGYVVHPGIERLALGDGITALPLEEL